MSDFFFKLNGFNTDYVKVDNAKIKEEAEEDKFDYSDVDFCQGEEVAEFEANIFGSEQGENYKNYDNDESIFKFD